MTDRNTDARKAKNMTNRLLHTDGKGTTLELTDTAGIHRLVITHEQGATITAQHVDIPARLANALLGRTDVLPLDHELSVALAQVVIQDGDMSPRDAYPVADKLVRTIRALLRAGTPAVPPSPQGVHTEFVPDGHRFDWEKRRAIDPKLLRDALLVAVNDQDALWDGVRDCDAQSVPAAVERAATVMERLLDGAGNQVEPWTPRYAVGILKAFLDDDAVNPAPHMVAAARGVLGLPFPENPVDAKVVGFDGDTSEQSPFESPFAPTRPVPGPVMYGSPWSGPFNEAARAKAFTEASSDETVIDAHVVDEDEPDVQTLYGGWTVEQARKILDQNPPKSWKERAEAVLSAAGVPREAKPETNPGKGNKDDKPGKGPKPDKPAKDEKPEKDKDGNGMGRRIAVLQYVVKNLDADLPFPDGPKGPAWEFYTASLLNVEAFIKDAGIDALVYDPIGEVASFGHGTPLDELDGHGLLVLAADLHAHAFDYEVDKPFRSLEHAVQTTLHRVYEDLWSVVADGLREGVLVVDGKGRVALAGDGSDTD